MSSSKIIKLSQSSNARSFANDDNGFLQEDAFNKVLALIERTLDLDVQSKATVRNNECKTTAFYEQRGHYSILVNGPRGSGKTTFALTALKKLEIGEGNTNKKFISLGILDPTLIDSREHVLLAVIAKIKEAVNSRFKHCVPERQESQSIFTKLSDPLDEWRQYLKRLANGLRELKSVDKRLNEDSTWDDAITIMGEGLEGIDAGLKLNQHLHEFIEQSLQVLAADAFVLVLDDIDTFFERGWPTLEALRKYLTSPKLITLVCGDLQLYETLVRKNQWKQLGQLATEYEKSAHNRLIHESMVYDLTEQYMLKILPAERRVGLVSVGDLENVAVESSCNQYQQDKNNAPTDDTLKVTIGKMLTQSYYLPENAAETQLFKQYFYRRPLRLVIQLLQSLKEGALPVSALQSIFAEWVYQHGASKLFQDITNNPVLVQQVLQQMHQSELMFDDLELLPRHINDQKNAGAAALSRVLCAFFAVQPSAGLDYMLRGGLARQAVYYTGAKQDNRPTDEMIMQVLGSITSDELLNVARQWPAVVVHGLSNSSADVLRLGTVQLLSEASFTKSRSKRAIKSLYRTNNPALVRAYAEAEANAQEGDKPFAQHSKHSVLSTALVFMHDYYAAKKTQEKSRHYAFSPLELQRILRGLDRPDLAEVAGLLFAVISHEKNSFHRASAFNLIAFLTGLIGLLSSAERIDKNELQIKINRELRRAGQIRTFPVPVNFDLAVQQTANEEELDDEEEQDSAGSEDAVSDETTDATNSACASLLADWLYEWVEVSSTKTNAKGPKHGLRGLNYPPFVWSRIWQRFFYTLEQLEKGLQTEQRYLGVIIHRQIVAFLNAVLVEEYRYQESMGQIKSNTKISLNNPVFADDLYNNNCKAIQGVSKQLPLYSHLASCPLWTPFLQEGHGGQSSINKESWAVLKQESNNSTAKLFDLLNMVSLANTSQQTLPTFWSHKDLQEHVFKNTIVSDILKSMLADHKPEDKNLESFITTHLARSKDKKTIEDLKMLMEKKQNTNKPSTNKAE